MSRPKTARSTNRAFTWYIKSTDLAIMQVTSPSDPVSGCDDCGCQIAKLERRNKRIKSLRPNSH